MMHSLFGRQLGIIRAGRLAPNRKARSRRLAPSVDGLERRNLMTGGAGGSVTLSGGAVTVAPAPSGPNAVTVSFQQVSGVTEVDVNLNGTDHDFALGSVNMVFFNGMGVAGNETFTNDTDVTTIAYGGSGTNLFVGGSGVDVFLGGSGSNTFDAGSGFDILLGGSGTNVYNESATGTAIIVEAGISNVINPPGGPT